MIPLFKVKQNLTKLLIVLNIGYLLHKNNDTITPLEVMDFVNKGKFTKTAKIKTYMILMPHIMVYE